MTNQIGTFIEFLLDTETTSEISFSQAILENDELYDKRYQNSFERVINQKLQQWKDFYEKEERANADRIAINAGSEVIDSQSEEEEPLSDDEDQEKTPQKTTVHQKDQVNLHRIL